jgi:hypothetical protein
MIRLEVGPFSLRGTDEADGRLCGPEYDHFDYSRRSIPSD